MLQSFLTITFRILWRNKVTSFVNILGLGIAMASVVFIMLYVQHETGYDKFNENYNLIYRLEGDDFAKLPPIVGSLVNDRLPEVTHVARLAGGWKTYISYSPEASPERTKQIEVNHYWADSTTFQVFTFPFVHGDPRTALRQPMSVVITESTAKKLFGDTNPMMKTVKTVDGEFMVTGVIKDVKNSHVEIDVLFSFSSIPRVMPEFDINKTASSAWLWSATYLLMTDNIDEKHTEEKINQELRDINGRLFDTEFKRFHIRAFRDLYFDGNVVNQSSYGLHGNLTMIRTLLIIGVFILFLAGINYTNLTTARAVIRTKEVAMKRITGSSVNQLRAQLILESIIVSAIAFVVAMTFIQLGLPAFNQLTMVNITQDDVNRPLIWMSIAAGSLVIGVLAGIYPAFYLTAVQPVRLIKGQWLGSSDGSVFRSVLMTFQFTLSIVMIIAVIVNFRQMRYSQNADLGFDKKLIVTVDTPGNSKDGLLFRQVFKERLLQRAGIERVTYSAGNLGDLVGDMPLHEINGMERSAKAIYVDKDYTDVLGITFSDGRGFSLNESSYDSINASTTTTPGEILVNESLVREFALDHPVGQIIYPKSMNRNASLIVGVVKDFHYGSFHDKIEPMIIMRVSLPGNVASIKIASSNIRKTMEDIESEWKRVWGDVPIAYKYKFLDDTFNQLYTKDVQLATSVGYFTGLAVVIACLGLFALSSFMVSRRTKEIGVRKTLGASFVRIYCMLSWDFLKWILLAVLIACPVAWFVMQRWLETFAYHVTIGLDVFVMASLLSITIALITVTWQSLKAARANPVKSLRYE
jgi:putative ABC transport system permease protein